MMKGVVRCLRSAIRNPRSLLGTRIRIIRIPEPSHSCAPAGNAAVRQLRGRGRRVWICVQLRRPVEQPPGNLIPETVAKVGVRDRSELREAGALVVVPYLDVLEQRDVLLENDV